MSRKLGPKAVPESVLQNSDCSRSKIDFFSSGQNEIRAAKNMCSTCPVRMECLVYALDAKELFGVWGGADGKELRTALNLDRMGAPEKAASAARCPFCRSVRRVDVTRTPKTKTDVASCSGCGLTWRRARSPRASSNTAQNEEQKTA